MAKAKKTSTRTKKVKGLTLQFLPYAEIEGLSSGERVKKLLQIILKDKVVIIQGRLRVEEETRLIEDTMALVGAIKGFKGIELAVISPSKDGRTVWNKFRHGMAHVLVGQTDSLTVIGPATVIKDVKKDPSKLEIMMSSK